MTRKRRRFAALLGLFLLASLLLAVPAMALEGEDATPSTRENGSGGVISFPEDPAPPTPTPEPTPEPTPDPTPEPTPEPTPVPQDPPADDPDPGDTEENGQDSPGYVPATHATPTPTPSPTPNATPHPSATPGPALQTPKPAGNTASGSPSAGESADGPRYVTFARLNQKNNSLAVTLFYGGAGCVLLGGGGVAALLVMIFRGSARKDSFRGEQEAVLRKIENAESGPPPLTLHGSAHRSPPPSELPLPAGRQSVPRQSVTREPVPRQSVPRESVPRQQGTPHRPSAPYAPLPPVGTQTDGAQLRKIPRTAPPQKPDPNAPIVPKMASMYTEEFPVYKPAAPKPASPAPTPKPASQPIPKPTSKPEPKPTPKPEPKPASKPAPQPAPKPAPKAMPETAPEAPGSTRTFPLARPEEPKAPAKQGTKKPAAPEQKPKAPRSKQKPAAGVQLPGQLSLLGDPSKDE